MNVCSFYGRVVDAPQVEKNAEGISVAKLTLSVDRYRKSKAGGKVRERNYLPLEAYDSAAQTLEKYCQKGSFLLVNATARSDEKGILFRVTEFRILQDNVPEVD